MNVPPISEWAYRSSRICTFAVKLTKSSYTDEEKIKEVAATLRMEGLKLSDSDLSMLQEIKSGNMSIDDARTKILSEV